MKKIFLIILLLTLLIINSGCAKSDKSDRVLNREQEHLMRQANAQLGMPAIKNFQERKLMKQIFELRDQENLICYCYLAGEQQGVIGQFLGKCIGYGLPYATQYTNPMKGISGDNAPSYTETAIPQADPNGLYMPASADASWVMLIDPKTNEPRPVYIEPKVIISPFPLK